MTSDIVISKGKPALAAFMASKLLSLNGHNIKLSYGDDNTLKADKLVYRDVVFSNPAAILRYLAPYFATSDNLQNTEIDDWLNFAYERLASTTNFKNAIENLDQVLLPKTYLVGRSLSLADLAVWEVLHLSSSFRTLFVSNNKFPNVVRYYKFLTAQKPFSGVAATFPAAAVKEEKKRTNETSIKKDKGKFIEMLGAEMGKVCVRFSLEASGHLHLGHAKAALLNQHCRDIFKGTLIMRLDDTNPAKEDGEFKKDIDLLGITYDKFSHTSDHFDYLLTCCERLIKDDKAYVDDTDPEVMKKEREERVESKNRNNDVAKNLELWKEMVAGTPRGQKCCVRAKIDMKSDNDFMRDPTMYQCKVETHVKTGNKYKVYPTYDFACPIVDSIENVTHLFSTAEHHDHDEQYFWFLEALGLRKPYINEYSRLNLENTVMSKRKLAWFVNEGLVEGWNDPRLPTVEGVLRRGITVEGLKQFSITQGSSCSVNMKEWDKICTYNKKVIDPVVPRYTALLKSDVVTLNVPEAVLESKEVAKHPKNSDVGNKTVWYGPKVLINGADAKDMSEGKVVTLINWDNLKIKKINRNSDKKITSVDAELNFGNTDYKKTKKIPWLAEAEDGPFISTIGVKYDHIITKGVLGKDEDFKQYINKDSKQEEEMLGDPCLASLRKGDIILLRNKGYYICDKPYERVSPNTGGDKPCILINIPEGYKKEMPKAGSKHKETKEPSHTEVKLLEHYFKPTSPKKFEEHVTQRFQNLFPKFCEPADLKNALTELKIESLVQNFESGETVEKRCSEFTKITVKDYNDAQQELLNIVCNEKGNMIVYRFATAPTTTDTNNTNATGIQTSTKTTTTYNEGHYIATTKEFVQKIDSESKSVMDCFKCAYSSIFRLTSEKIKLCYQVLSQRILSHEDIMMHSTTLRTRKNWKVWKEHTRIISSFAVYYLSLQLLHNKINKSFLVIPNAESSPVSTAAPSQSFLAVSYFSKLIAKIIVQNKKVMDLNPSKSNLDSEVQTLLALKTEFREAVGQEWIPGMTSADSSPVSIVAPSPSFLEVLYIFELIAKITVQDKKVTDLKSSNTPKSEVESEVQTLQALEKKFREAVGQEWKPGMTSAESSPISRARPSTFNYELSYISELITKITAQGKKVTDLKASDTPKSEVDFEVQILLALKKKFREAVGQEWKPGMTSAESSPVSTAAPSPSFLEVLYISELITKITAQGKKVTDFKASNTPKSEVDSEVQTLHALKKKFREVVGQEWEPGMTSAESSPVSAAALSPFFLKVLNISELIAKITVQDKKVTDLQQIQSSKIQKSKVNSEVQTLQALKKKFREAVGQEWKSSLVSAAAPPSPSFLKVLYISELFAEITVQQKIVTDLNTSNTPKNVVDKAMNRLSMLENKYKLELDTKLEQLSAEKNVVDEDMFSLETQLKQKRAEKSKINAEEKTFNQLEKEFKTASGNDWQPSATESGTTLSSSSSSVAMSSKTDTVEAKALKIKIDEQGEKVRQLKSSGGGDKSKINAEEKTFNQLEKEFKTASGNDWQPSATESGTTLSSSSSSVAMSSKTDTVEAKALKIKIDEQGEKVRQLKSSGGGDKAAIDAAVQTLLNLKAQYKDLTGENLSGGARGGKKAGKDEKKDK